MEEVSWYVGLRITRAKGGGIHWFVESADGLSHGHLVDEGTPATLMSAMLACRREVAGELFRLHAALWEKERSMPPPWVQLSLDDPSAEV